jgi:nucleotide-binding universal stress UspA family protein
MNTVIVPVDFSDTSLNAARYAVKLLAGHPGVEMILYHMFVKPNEEENSIENIENLKNELLQGETVNISTLTEMGGDFVEELEKLTRHRQADLVIMGITGRSSLQQIFMGSNALKMAENKFCPVMIVPPNCQFREVKNVLLTSDLKDVMGTTPSVPIKKVLKTFQPSLHVVNVNEDTYIALSEEHENEKQKLSKMFEEFNPEFYFLRLFDIDEAINEFANDKNIDLIINIQKEHSKFYRFFKSSHTKALAYQSTIPVLVVHE